jgi:hypothetical protein
MAGAGQSAQKWSKYHATKSEEKCIARELGMEFLEKKHKEYRMSPL